jgi:hypothetical protein
MYWRRNGDQLEVRGNFTTGTTTAVEARLSFPDATTTASAFSSIRIAGSAIRAGSSATFFSDNVLSEPSVSYFTFGVQASTSSGLTKVLGSGFASTTKETISASTSISQWSSGTTTLADRAVEEYVFNTNTTYSTLSELTAFGYGLNGTTLPSAALTGDVVRRVQFTTPILPTDNINVEISTDRNVWIPMTQQTAGINNYIGGTATSYGLGWTRVTGSVTQADVNIARYRRPAGTWDGAGADWSGTVYYRIRKVSGGAAVGFPIAPANIVLVNTADNYSGNTALGLMQYAHGTTYNGGNAPTVTLTAGGGTLSSVTRAVFVPYQMADGSWRMKFNVYCLLSSLSRSAVTLNISGVTIKSGFAQPVVGYVAGTGIPPRTRVETTGNIQFDLSAAVVLDAAASSGDVELNSKPTWAY